MWQSSRVYGGCTGAYGEYKGVRGHTGGFGAYRGLWQRHTEAYGGVRVYWRVQGVQGVQRRTGRTGRTEAYRVYRCVQGVRDGVAYGGRAGAYGGVRGRTGAYGGVRGRTGAVRGRTGWGVRGRAYAGVRGRTGAYGGVRERTRCTGDIYGYQDSLGQGCMERTQPIMYRVWRLLREFRASESIQARRPCFKETIQKPQTRLN